MRHLSNIFNPAAADAQQSITRSFHETPEQAWRHHLEWLTGKVIGPPKATATYSVEQLEGMGMVGVYLPDGKET
jgi:hypothetical protein